MLEELLQFNGNNSITELISSVHQGIPSVVFGVNNSFKYYLLSKIPSPVLFISPDVLSANSAKAFIESFSNKKVTVIPHKDEITVIRKAFSKDSYYERIKGVEEIENSDIVIVTPQSIMQSFPVRGQSFFFVKGEDVDREKYLSFLITSGYKRVDVVESKGTFSLRGDTLDVFPINIPSPVKVDFFGDTVDSIKIYNEETRDISGYLQTVCICPAVDSVVSAEKGEYLLSKMSAEIKDADGEKYSNLRSAFFDAKTMIENSENERLSVYYGALSQNFFDGVVKKDTVVVIDDSKKIYETASLYYAEFSERLQSLVKVGGAFGFMRTALLSPEILKDKLNKFTLVSLQSLTTQIPIFNPQKIINAKVSSVANYRLDFSEFFRDVDRWLHSGYSVLVCTGENKRAERLCGELSDNGIASSVCSVKKLSGVCLCIDNLDDGFVFHEGKVVVIGSGNLYAKKTEEKRLKTKKQTFFSAPKAGDYCVHEIYGIGKVIGNKKVSSSEGIKDCVVIEYADGDILYVPVTHMDNLSRYLGAEKTPRLSKIGSKDFERIKQRVKESIKKMSFDLKKLYKERKEKVGFKFAVDGELQSLFNNSFAFEDTFDQITATEEILSDMQSSVVMDRLLCGDVGFGKTEVAFRAVFLAITNGKQVALLAPTTILTEQHYNTAKERFSDFGVKIACLNRFRTAKEQRDIVSKLKAGEIDLVIGTHRLLGKDVGFYDLGLLILDEEQRFGVEHKEKIKLLKKNVDTLTLTATPIPRTLNMSLTGIRQISTLNTPPKKRLPVQTYVTEESDLLIYDAVTREVNRGGQVFILYNRVESIYAFCDRIKTLLPKVGITVAHGQMDERTLENNIIEFYQGNSDVLISTTIIENGIDLPKANTLIVIDADNLGLSTLYQLKGRVGRSDRLAYAYFTYKRDKVLTEQAYERLEAIMQFAEMGSGIKIAMRDLEIRGAGNVLGAEQHGHMDKIGYELYSKLLKEELTGTPDRHIELDIRVSAYIPEDYIGSTSARMDAYKQIAEIESAEDEQSIITSLAETYGSIPDEVDNLILIAVIKRMALSFDVLEINVIKGQGEVVLSDFKTLGNENLRNAIDGFGKGVVIDMAEKPKLSFISPSEDNRQMLFLLKKFFISATNTDSGKE